MSDTVIKEQQAAPGFMLLAGGSLLKRVVFQWRERAHLTHSPPSARTESEEISFF